MDFGHEPVMTGEVVRLLGCRPGGLYVDCTIGGGGHALAILEATGPGGRLIGLDRDGDALKAARGRLEPFAARVELVRENFRNIKEVLQERAAGPVDGMLFDLGVSSYQLEQARRGFSFMREARLDMRMDLSQELTAYDLVNGLTRGELIDTFKRYGEERRSARIASAIVRAREQRPIETTIELAEIVKKALGPGPRRRRGAVHPATRVFQALRIRVNDELEGLASGLASGAELLRAGSRMVVISFHSLEDRLVKGFFRDLSTACTCPPRIPKCVCNGTASARLLTRRVLRPSMAEVERNPRSRSARLRAVEIL